MTDYGLLIINSLLLGIGIAVDAFIVALANGMNSVKHKSRVPLRATTQGLFHSGAMFIGWLIAHTAFTYFDWLELCFSWAAFGVLVILGVKMFVDCIRHGKGEHEHKIAYTAFLAQCAATSVDALTVGFTVVEYNVVFALICAAIVAVITVAAYIIGHKIGYRFGMKFERAAMVVGGGAFIAIAVEIIITTYR